MAIVGRGCDQFMLRLPDGMCERIKEIAAQNRRSMNSEVVVMLERVVGKSDQNEKGDEAAA